MKNNIKLFAIFSGLWTFGFVTSFQSFFTQSSTFLLSHNISSMELILGIIILYLFIPLVLTIIYIVLDKKTKSLTKNYFSLVVTFLMSLGITKMLDNFYTLETQKYIIFFTLTIITILFLSLKIKNLSSKIFYISIFTIIQLVFLITQTDVPKYLKYNSQKSISEVQTNKKNIYLILLDELSLSQILIDTDTINKYRFPGFHKLSTITTFYPNTTSNAGFTEYSVPSILTGVLPEQQNSFLYPRFNYYFPENLINLLSKNYKVEADELVTNFCVKPNCKSMINVNIKDEYRKVLKEDLQVIFMASILPKQTIEKKYPQMQNSWGDFVGKLEKKDLQSSLSSFDRLKNLKNFIYKTHLNTNENFIFMHVVFPHDPFEFLPNGKKIPKSRALENTAHGLDLSNYGLLLNQAYLLQLKYLDNIMLDLSIKIQNEYKDDIVIITSDHGVSFQNNKSGRGDFDNEIPNAKTLASVLYVPLFIHYPGQEVGNTNLKNVQLIDIYPTVLSLLNLPNKNLSSKIDGIPIQESKQHENLNWYNHKFNLSHQELSKGLDELIKRNETIFGNYLGECDLYGVGPFKENICKRVNEFNIVDSQESAILINKEEVKDNNYKKYAYNLKFLIYSDNLSEELKKNKQLEKWYAISYKDKISNIGKGIVSQSLRDSGTALDLQIMSLLFGIDDEIDLGEVRIFEIVDEKKLEEIKIQQ